MNTPSDLAQAIAEALGFDGICANTAAHQVDEILDKYGIRDCQKMSRNRPVYHVSTHAILNQLNKESGKSYRHVHANLSLISARLNEIDVAPSRVLDMIKRQCKLWKGTNMETYLRPETLFRKSKFDSYYAQAHDPVGPALTPTSGQKETWQLARELETLEKLAKELRDRYCFDGPLGSSWDDDDKRKDYVALKKKCLDLRKLLTQSETSLL